MTIMSQRELLNPAKVISRRWQRRDLTLATLSPKLCFPPVATHQKAAEELGFHL